MKNIIKRIIVGVAIVLIVGLFKSCEVKAKELDSVNMPTTTYTLLNTKILTATIKSSPGAFVGYGSGKILFSFYAPVGENTSYNSVIDVTITNYAGFVSKCKTTSTYHINYQNYPGGAGSGSTYGGIIYFNECDVNLRTNVGVVYTTLTFRNSPSVSQVVVFGQNVTFVSDTDNAGVIDAIRQYSSLNTANSILSQLQNYQVQTGQQLGNITNIINNQTTTQQQMLQKQEETKQELQEMNDFLTDSSLPNNSSSDIADLNSNIGTNGTISSLVTMPITFLQKIINGLNGSCSPITIGELYNYNMTMPCINPQSYIGNIWNIIDVICAGFLSFHFGKKLVSIFHKITSMKDGGLEEAYD